MTARSTRSRSSTQKPPIDGQRLAKFQEAVLSFYREHGRHHLPWRRGASPYRVLVSEVMLQQTQVDRVIPYYKAFLKQFPTVRALAKAPLGDVLRVWSGLGYNRRAKMLHQAAQALEKRGRFPREYSDLVALPGVGEYTAKAVRVFAFNEPEVLIETNVRSVFIHHFFPRTRSVPDKKLFPLIAASVQGLDLVHVGAREWYAALMDYGSFLKKTVSNPSRKSAHHKRQKTFKGSDREIRGALIRAALDKPITAARIKKFPFNKERSLLQLKALTKEGILRKTRSGYVLAH